MSFLTQDTNLSAELSKEELFRTPTFISAKISPDGKSIAHVGADAAGIPNVFISSWDGNRGSAKQITSFTSPAIIQFFWAADSQTILFLRDEDGTGQLHLHGANIHSQEHVIHTQKFPQVNAKVIQVSSSKNSAMIGLNHRNLHFHDLYLLDLNTGNCTLFLENDTYAKFLISDDLELILKMRINDDGSWTVLNGKDELFMQLSARDAFHTEFLSYDAKKNAVYLLDNRFSDTNQLTIKTYLPLSEERVLGSQPQSDVDEVLFIEGKPKAYASYYTQKKWHVIDRDVEEDISFLEKKVGMGFGVVSQCRKGNVWIVSNSIPDQGEYFWLYERDKKNLCLLYSSKQHFALNKSFAKMYEIVVDARDGKKLICYYTLPQEYDRGGFVDRPIPLVVVPHGGPFKVRDKFEFCPTHQWLASCGYAVLSVNFRLSSGLGKAFVNAGNGEWGGKAHLDVIDAVEACIARGITENGKLAIFGGSYGGYETLAALTFTPEYFTCCIAVCGPSNLKTVLQSVPKFWEFPAGPLSDKLLFFTKSAFITSMGGNPDEMEGSVYLEKCSPLNSLDSIKAPLLLVHGKNDHVVTENESKQIYESMKQNEQQVTYILFPNEGHGCAKFANKMVYLDHAERFLSQHLKGRYHPTSAHLLRSSSAQIFY